MSGTVPVSRTAAWIEREYGQEKWPAVERIVADLTAREPPVLSRLLREVARREMGDAADEDADVVLNGTEVRLPRRLGWAAHDGMVVESVVAACGPTTDLVLDLGSGWGKHLLSVWLAGGPRGATYAAAEYTESGRRLAGTLAAFEPAIAFRSLPFDWRQPDLSSVAGHEEAVVFSVHSVEQVPALDAAAIATVAALAPSVTCLHFESVGWQLEGDSPSSSRAYADRNDYNRNLVEVLQHHEQAGRLRVDVARPNLVGVNPRNATSLVRWRATN